MGEPSPFLDAARTVALEAGRRVMELLRSPLETSRKSDHSIVTNADHDANTLICGGLRRLFPKHGILSEETGMEGPPNSEYLWVIDPIDGTRAFANGMAGFSVMVGLLREGKPLAGVVYDPRAQTLFEAERGQGAYLVGPTRRVPLHVSKRQDWLAMPVITSKGFPLEWQRGFEQKCGSRFMDPINSVGVKVGYLIRQLADLYLNHHPVHLWDTCAPQIILEEAGGCMTHWDGTPLAYSLKGEFSHPQGTLASNGFRHTDLVKIIGDMPKP
jgi:3'(2'), 5'-bisphosphate nucleotidase